MQSVSTQLPPAPPLMTHLDVERLSALLLTRVGTAYREEARRLREELRRAKVIAAHDAPRDLVTMNSKVLFADEGETTPREVTLVYPWRAHERCTVNVFSPLGTALLGMRVGRTTAPDGTSRTLRVIGLPYQPEAAGDWHL